MANGIGAPTGPETSERHSRFKVTARNQQPTALEAVLKALGKGIRKTGAFKQPDEVRGIFAGAHRDYAVRGAADDLYRFLKNFGVLVRDGEEGEIYFDRARGQTLAAACVAGCAPPPVRDPAAQLAALREQAAARRERPSFPGGDSGEIELGAEDPAEEHERQRAEFAAMVAGETEADLRGVVATLAAEREALLAQLFEREWQGDVIAAEFARRDELARKEERRRQLEHDRERKSRELEEAAAAQRARAEELARLDAELASLAGDG